MGLFNCIRTYNKKAEIMRNAYFRLFVKLYFIETKNVVMVYVTTIIIYGLSTKFKTIIKFWMYNYFINTKFVETVHQ